MPFWCNYWHFGCCNNNFSKFLFASTLVSHTKLLANHFLLSWKNNKLLACSWWHPHQLHQQKPPHNNQTSYCQQCWHKKREKELFPDFHFFVRAWKNDLIHPPSNVLQCTQNKKRMKISPLTPKGSSKQTTPSNGQWEMISWANLWNIPWNMHGSWAPLTNDVMDGARQSCLNGRSLIRYQGTGSAKTSENWWEELRDAFLGGILALFKAFYVGVILG